MAKTIWEGGELRLERAGNDLLLRMGGKLIAKRGRPGTRYAHTWISLEPGVAVRDAKNGDVVVEIRAASVH